MADRRCRAGGFHLGHRTTDDLDLLALQRAAFERSRFALADVAAAVGVLAAPEEPGQP